MDEIKDESDVIDVIERCKCCLSDEGLNSMWEIHLRDGAEETYGELLMDCFALSWDPIDSDEQICNSCVGHLKDAVNFKKKILDTDQVLNSAQIIKEEVTTESNECEIDYLETESNGLKSEAECESVEYLEEEVLSVESTDTPQKWPKKKPKSERLRTYKQYTQKALRQAIEAVKTGVLSYSEAAREHGVPKKTIVYKVNESCKDGGEEPKESSNEKHFKLVEELKKILVYTNAIPFKTKTTKYHCAYCSTDGPTFEDGDQVRNHTVTEHAHERINAVEKFMRPNWSNEIIKLDIDNLHCVPCRKLILDWNEMFVHFAEDHNLEFDEAYSKIIPYALTQELKCVLCKKLCHNFGQVDAHMNHHYSNYICYECGEPFLASTRLEKHLSLHRNIGRFPCKKCNKVFTLEKYRQKHENLVHSQLKTVKCLYCPKKFIGNLPRHLHVEECHKEKVKPITCEICGKVYTWKPYYLAHVKRKHSNERSHKCKHCNKAFVMKYELNSHMICHTRQKSFICGQCGEGFTRKVTLKKHCEKHLNDQKLYT